MAQRVKTLGLLGRALICNVAERSSAAGAIRFTRKLCRDTGAYHNAEIGEIGSLRKWAEELSDYLDRVEAG